MGLDHAIATGRPESWCFVGRKDPLDIAWLSLLGPILVRWRGNYLWVKCHHKIGLGLEFETNLVNVTTASLSTQFPFPRRVAYSNCAEKEVA